MTSFAGAAFGVLADARGRQQRRRRRILGVALLALVLSPILAYVVAGGGPRRTSGPVVEDRAALNYAWRLRLAAGPEADRFTITAPADRAYVVAISAPATTAAVMRAHIGPGAGWTLATPSDTSCSTNANHTYCILHFAAGGNPGGTWTIVVRKTSARAATVHIFLRFNRHTGDYTPT
jgi:hypothetical protein